MTEVLFYHLQNMSLENVLPPLLEKSLERGWRVVVQSTSPERADALDAHLWTYRDDSFLPHATWRVADVADQPIVLAIEDGNPNGAQVRFLVDNAPLPPDSASYERMVLVFNGDDDDARSLDRLQGAGVRVHLLAGRRTRSLAAPAIARAQRTLRPWRRRAINDNLSFIPARQLAKPRSCRKVMVGRDVTASRGGLEHSL
jgi:DNA polymerase III subunit chi